jgi:hypothetical protein
MASRVFSVGLQIPGDAAEYVSLRSDRSLFDADVAIFCPHFDDYHSVKDYLGSPLLTEHDSARITADLGHWKAELKAAVESGKCVFVFLRKPEEVYYDTGARSYSGTGKSRATTRHLAGTTSYDALPASLQGLTPRTGTEIRVMRDLGPLAAYWTEFGAESSYQVYFDSVGQPTLGTKRGEKVVGTIIRSSTGGALVLLPLLSWDLNALTYTRGRNSYWRADAVRLGKRFVGAIVAAAGAFQRSGERSPAPEWVLESEYALETAHKLEAEILQVDGKMEKLAARRLRLAAQLEDARTFHALLYESGSALEEGILRTLRLLGFTATRVRTGDSEFDAVFSSEEGRFLGEAEGKDTKPINIDKMSQLERNLQEDFAREEIQEYAKGVLFGNAYRFKLPSERGDFFTAKCRSAAKRLGVALVRTPDLFAVAQYLSHNDDPAYSKSCRLAMFRADGMVVEFPDV